MDKLDIKEKVWGGVFGIVAIFAAIGEMLVNGVDASSLLGAVKDVAGTMVVVILLVAFINSLPRRPKNLLELLTQAVEKWGEDNAPLIFKTEGYVAAQNSLYTQGFVLLQDPKKYVSLANSHIEKGSAEWQKYAQYGNNRLTGKFLDMPSYEAMTQADYDVLFVMEQSHFSKMETIDAIVNEIIAGVSTHCGGGISASRVGNSLKFKVSYKAIGTKDDVNSFIDSLDFVLSLVKVIA